jgi:hypothetical protein
MMLRALVPKGALRRWRMDFDFLMTNGPLASRKENYVHSWLYDTVEGHQHLFDNNMVCFATSDFKEEQSAFRLMITCSVRHYGFLFRTLPPHIYRQYLVVAYKAVCTAVFRSLGISQDVQTLDKLKCAKR